MGALSEGGVTSLINIEDAWCPNNLHHNYFYPDKTNLDLKKRTKALVSVYDITEREAIAVQKFIADLKRSRVKKEQANEPPKEVKKTLRRPVALY